MPQDKWGEEQRLFTFVVTGPNPLSLEVGGNPSLSHTGGNSVTHLVVEAEEAQRIRDLILLSGNQVELRAMGGQTPDQTKERAQLISLAQEERVWPAIKCPTCPWFDPIQPEGSLPCGLDSMPQEAQAILRETSPLHVEAREACSVRGR